MTRVGIWELRDRLPSQVSGGQLERAGICRALNRATRIVFCDEPSGALNSSAATETMHLLCEFHTEATVMAARVDAIAARMRSLGV